MVVFFPEFCIFQDLSNGQVKGIGREDQGLYVLKEGLSSLAPVQSPTSSANSIGSSESISLWHRRLGHAPLDVIKWSSSISLTDVATSNPCTVCPLAKQSKLSFPLSTHLSKSVFELVHCNIWGPYRIPTHNGMRYFVTIVDDFSRYTWVFIMTSKSDTIVVLMNFFTQVKNLFLPALKL